MFKNKPVTLLITAALLILLIAAAGVYPLISGSIRTAGFGGMDGGNRPQMQGSAPGGDMPSGGNAPSDMTPPDGARSGNGQSSGNAGGNGQFTPGGSGGNFTGTMPGNTGVSMKLMQLLQIVQSIGAVLVLIFAVLAILGIFLSKDWGRKLALTAGIVATVFSVAGMFGFLMGISLWIKVAALIISVAIVVLSCLRKSRIQTAVPV